MRLRILAPSGKSSEIVVTGTPVRLGRDPGCEVYFNPNEYPMVSGEHARLERVGPEVVLTALSRSNKTLLNDQPLEGPVNIKKGDRIGLGYTGPCVEIVAVGSTVETAPEPLPYEKETSAFAVLPPAALGQPPEKAPAIAQPSIQDKAKQPAAQRLAKPPAATRVPVIKRRPLPAARFQKGLAWGALGATGVVVVAAVIFVLTRGGTPADSEPGLPLPPEKKSVATLALTLQNGSPLARKEALEDLNQRGPQARAALAAVLEVLQDNDPELRSLARQTLDRLGPPSNYEVPIYSAALRVSSPEARAYAAGQLGKLGKQTKSELAFLRGLSMDDDDNMVKDAAQKAVLGIETDMLAGLTEGLKDQSADKRTKAARELADMGAGAKDALPTLLDTLADNNIAVRKAVREVFVAIGPDAVMLLGEELSNKKNPQVRLIAIEALGRMGPDARFVMRDLIAVLFDADATAQQEAMAALERIGDYAIPYLVKELEREKDPARQKPLIAALERIGHDAGPSVRKALEKAKPELGKAPDPLLDKLLDKIPSQPSREPPKEHTGTAGEIQRNLMGQFNDADTNKDGFLDKEELAHFMRGSNAKPYDDPSEGKRSRPLDSRDFKEYPDYAFLCRVDRDNDGKISREEFARWAYDIAEVMKKEYDYRKSIQEAQLSLAAQNLSGPMRAQKEAELASLQGNYYEYYNNNVRPLGFQNQWTWLRQVRVIYPPRTVFFQPRPVIHPSPMITHPPRPGIRPPPANVPPPRKK